MSTLLLLLFTRSWSVYQMRPRPRRVDVDLGCRIDAFAAFSIVAAQWPQLMSGTFNLNIRSPFN
jgi:hypothetical protein